MNLLVVGVSYRTATVSLLERLAAAPQEASQLLTDLVARPYVGEAMVLSTCNRVEVYAAVTAFHGGLADIAEVLAARAGCAPADLAGHMYVYFEAEAARHAFRVATGLDSMVVGEAQILGQLREAYALATERDTAGRTLHELMQQALRVGKRAHTETGIDAAGRTVVAAALTVAARRFGPGGIEGRRTLVVGAGSMGSLALATLKRAGAGPLSVTNRDAARAQRLASAYGAAAVPFEDLATALADVDLVVCATAADGHVIGPSQVTGPVMLLDLAVPRDVDPAVAAVPGVTLIDMQGLGAEWETGGAPAFGSDEAEVAAIVESEVDAYRLVRRGADAAPTVAALRARADDVVGAEMARLRQRRPDLTDAQRAEVAQTVHRVVQQLLHQPTVRVRELAAGPGGDHYAQVLRDLFALEVPPPAPTAADVPTGVCETHEDAPEDGER
ncbi:MAG TPA: glutamyl-tRNA reductase [Micromonosporaceae bacterium]|nr:glutamyl-tRNA reductase [Micromonosporaceae bacterium]